MKKIIGIFIFSFLILVSSADIYGSEADKKLYPDYINDVVIAEAFVDDGYIEGLESIDQILTEEEFNEGADKVNELFFADSSNEINNYDQFAIFNNLTKLYFYFMELDAIPEEIYELSNLEYLGLNYNNITSLDGIEKMTSLKGLDVATNQITSFDSVLSLDNLEELDLSENNIESFDKITTLTSLKSLTLRKCELTSFEGLEELTSLKELDLSINDLTYLHGFENLEQLETIYLFDNNISSIDSFENLTKLTHLELYNNPIGDLDSLTNLENLKEIDLSNTQMTTIDNILNSEELKYLYLSNNQIESINGIENLTNLEYLLLDYNDLDSGVNYEERIGGLINLESLDLSGSEISSLTFLDDLDTLTELVLSNNNITSLNGIEDLTLISKLYLDNNQIEDIEPLANFHTIYDLNLSNNNINDIEPLRAISPSNFLGLDLSMNNIINFEPLQDSVDGYFTYFTDQSIEVYLPSADQYIEVFQEVNCLDDTCNFIPDNYELNGGVYSNYISHEILEQNDFTYSLVNYVGGGLFQENYNEDFILFSADITVIPFNEVTISNPSDYISEIIDTDIIELIGASLTDIDGNDITDYLYVEDTGGFDIENPTVGTYDITLKFSGNDEKGLSQLTNDYQMVVTYEVMEDEGSNEISVDEENSEIEEEMSIKEAGNEYHIILIINMIVIIYICLKTLLKS